MSGNTHAPLSVSKKKSHVALSVDRCLHCQREQTISVPSGYMSEFPRSLPISILLGCDTRPDVAAPLTSRLSLPTGCVDSSSQGHGEEGGVCRSTASVPMMYSWIYPLCSWVHNWLIKPPCPVTFDGCLLGSVVSCWDSGLLPDKLRWFFADLLQRLLSLCKADLAKAW